MLGFDQETSPQADTLNPHGHRDRLMDLSGTDRYVFWNKPLKLSCRWCAWNSRTLSTNSNFSLIKSDHVSLIKLFIFWFFRWDYWWLVDSYLIDGIGLVSWLFWEFYMILFLHMWGEIEPTWGEIEINIRISELGKTQISFLGGGAFGGWGGVCEVRYVRWDTWDEVHEVRYDRWGLDGGDLCWVGWGMRGGECKVIFTGGEIYASHLVKFFAPWYFYKITILCVYFLIFPVGLSDYCF